MEALLMARRLAIIVAGIAFQDAFWAVVACLSTYIVMWKVIIVWKPYATQGSQFDARLVQAVILLLLVRIGTFCMWALYFFLIIAVSSYHPRAAVQLLMLARLNGNFPPRFLLALEIAWCFLYFSTMSHIAVACIVSCITTLGELCT